LTLRVTGGQSTEIHVDETGLDATSARLAQHRRDLGRLCSVLSHDLRAHLNSMVLNLELLQRTAAAGTGEDDGKAPGYASRIASELQGLERRLRAVMGQMSLTVPSSGHFDLRYLVEDLAIVFESLARERHIRIRATLPEVPVTVLGDRDAVNHLLTSLLTGSVDALPNGALLSLALRADRGTATLSLSGAPAAPADSPVEPDPIVFWTREPAAGALAAARETLKSNPAARLVISSGSRESARLDIELPLAPLARSKES